MTNCPSPALTVSPQATSGPLVGALLYDGLCTFEFGIVAEIFALARPEMGTGWYRFASCAIDPAPLRAHGGFSILPDQGPELLKQADIIVVPGWKGAEVAVPPELVALLQSAHARGARLISICSGAFVLAATGLLDGATATTHWRYADSLQRQYPAVKVDATSLYQGHDRLYTSAGSAAGIDLLLHIIHEDFGASAANSVARRLVVPAHRNGGQAQFIERPVAKQAEGAIAPLLDAMRARLHEEWPIEKMARSSRMSARSFQRHFQRATGKAPGEWLTQERIEAAKSLLCQAGGDMETLAQQVGFGSAFTLRHHFRKTLGISPSEYRTRFLNKS